MVLFVVSTQKTGSVASSVSPFRQRGCAALLRRLCLCTVMICPVRAPRIQMRRSPQMFAGHSTFDFLCTCQSVSHSAVSLGAGFAESSPLLVEGGVSLPPLHEPKATAAVLGATVSASGTQPEADRVRRGCIWSLVIRFRVHMFSLPDRVCVRRVAVHIKEGAADPLSKSLPNCASTSPLPHPLSSWSSLSLASSSTCSAKRQQLFRCHQRPTALSSTRRSRTSYSCPQIWCTQTPQYKTSWTRASSSPWVAATRLHHSATSPQARRISARLRRSRAHPDRCRQRRRMASLR